MMTMLTQPAVAATGNRARVRRYRGKHRRIDYVPSADALKIIEFWLAQGLSNCNAGVIDHLVLAGHRAMSGHTANNQAPGDSERSARAREASTEGASAYACAREAPKHPLDPDAQ